MKREELSREEYFKLLDEKVKNRIPKHKRWKDIISVTGYIDSNGQVHAIIHFMKDGTKTHGELFPAAMKYKTWRWYKGSGLQQSSLCSVNMTKEDWHTIQNWLYKNGCLNDWELDLDM